MMNGESLNIQQDNLSKLKEQFPNLFTEDKLDWEKLKAVFGDDINFSNERYVLNWAGKADAFKALQISTTDSLKPLPNESINFDTTENIFIEGENLEVLKVLQKSYYNKIKCIIIDPPYNTGSDSFLYPDKFKESKEEYQKRIGDKDEEGYLMREGMFRKNSKDSGHFHSNWLNMIYPRLFLAKNLMCEDGVIFVFIDDNELHNLKLVMNEIFGEENYLSCFVWEKRTNRENRKIVSSRHDYVLCYCRDSSKKENLLKPLPMSEEALARYKNPDNDPRGRWKSDPATAQAGHGTKSQFYTLEAPNGKKHELQSGRCWLYTKEVMDEAIKDGRIWFGNDGNGVPRIKTYLDSKERGLTPESILFAEEASTNEDAKNYLKELFDGKAVFETPKPVELIEILLKLGAGTGLVLDFFAGSSATAEAVLRLNNGNKFIMVQVDEPCDPNSIAFEAGYKNIAEISKDRIRRAIEKFKNESNQSTQLGLDLGQDSLGVAITKADKQKSDLGFKVFKLIPSNFKIWRSNEINEENLVQQLEAFTNPVHASSPEQNMLYELILKSGYLLTDKVEKYEIVNEGLDEKRHIKTSFYIIADGELIIALDKINPQVIELIIEQSPKKVIMLDNLFAGNDQLKTNTVLQMKDAGIDFKTI